MTKETKSNVPSHNVYRVEGQGQNAKWIKVGALWPSKNGYTQVLSCIDKDLRFVIQERITREDTYAEE